MRQRSSSRTLLLSCLLLGLLVACGGEEPTPSAEQDVATGEESAASPFEGTVSSFDGLPIHYRDEGSGSPALVFIHCWSCDASYWHLQVPAVTSRYRFVAVDLAGHGSSGSERESWTIESLGRDVAAVVEELDLDRVILVGHSMGARVMLEAARLLPGRTVGLIAVDALHDLEVEHDREEFEELRADLAEDFSTTVEELVSELFLDDANPELVQTVASDLAAAPPEVGVALIEASYGYDVLAAVERLDVPLYAINGTLRETATESNRTHVPDYRVAILEGTGHFPMLEAPASFNQALLGLTGLLAEDEERGAPPAPAEEAPSEPPSPR